MLEETQQIIDIEITQKVMEFAKIQIEGKKILFGNRKRFPAFEFVSDLPFVKYHSDAFKKEMFSELITMANNEEKILIEEYRDNGDNVIDMSVIIMSRKELAEIIREVVAETIKLKNL